MLTLMCKSDDFASNICLKSLSIVRAPGATFTLDWADDIAAGCWLSGPVRRGSAGKGPEPPAVRG